MEATRREHRHSWKAIPGLESFPQRLCRCGMVWAPQGVKAGKRSTFYGDSFVRWDATATPTAAGQLGMDLATGRPKAFVGGASKDIAVSGDPGDWDLIDNPSGRDVVVIATDTSVETTVYSFSTTLAALETLAIQCWLRRQHNAGTTRALKIRYKVGATTVATIETDLTAALGTYVSSPRGWWEVIPLNSVVSQISFILQMHDTTTLGNQGTPTWTRTQQTSAIDLSASTTFAVTAQWVDGASSPALPNQVDSVRAFFRQAYKIAATP